MNVAMGAVALTESVLDVLDFIRILYTVIKVKTLEGKSDSALS